MNRSLECYIVIGTEVATGRQRYWVWPTSNAAAKFQDFMKHATTFETREEYVIRRAEVIEIGGGPLGNA